jgi:hypothetical protein
MIKKFKQYIKENDISVNGFTTPYGRMSMEDVEDQFLRLREVLGCEVIIKYDNVKMQYVIGVNPGPDKRPIVYRGSSEIHNELDQVIYRIENVYPGLQVKTVETLRGCNVFIQDKKLNDKLKTLYAGYTDSYFLRDI